MKRRWKLILATVVGVAALVFGYDLLVAILWDGSADLEIEFVVTDKVSGRPVEKATISIRSRSDSNEVREKETFSLETGPDGMVRTWYPECMTSGTRSGLGITSDTFVVHPPHWDYHVSAESYATTRIFRLDEAENVTRVQRVGPRQAKLVIPVMLRKAPEPDAQAKE